MLLRRSLHRSIKRALSLIALTFFVSYVLSRKWAPSGDLDSGPDPNPDKGESLRRVDLQDTDRELEILDVGERNVDVGERNMDVGERKVDAGDRSEPGNPPLRERHESHTKKEEPACLGFESSAPEFQFAEVDPDRLYVFSAFWDNRPNDFDNTINASYIRIMAVVRTKQKPLIQVHCTFSPLGQVHGSRESLTSAIQFYEMCENHGQKFGGFILSCPVPREFSKRPCSVTVTNVNTPLSSVTLNVRSLALAPEESRQDFAVCIPPLFGNVEPVRLTEFIEMSRIQGAEHFVFYNLEVPQDVARVLDRYQALGLVTVVPWNYPENLKQNSWYNGQLIAIQDCLYRTMPLSDFIAFNDIDEFIIPRRDANWNDLISSELHEATQCALQFGSAYFNHKVPIKGPALMTMLSTTRTLNFSNTRTKCLVRASLIFEEGIHHVSKPLFAQLEVHRVSESVALLHHYRRCTKEKFCSELIDDSFLLKYRDKLKTRVSIVLEELDLMPELL